MTDASPAWEPPFPLPPELELWLRGLLSPALARAKQLPAGILFSAPGNHGQVPLIMSLARAYLDNRVPDPALESDLVLLRPEADLPLHHRPMAPPGGASPSWGVDPIREGLDQLSLAPLRARRRLFLLEGAEHLTPAAGNALLKSVEEQGRLQTALFLFTSQDVERVLPPLRARFVPVTLPPLPRTALAALLGAQKASPSWDEALSRGGGCLDRTSWYLSPAGAAWGRNLRSLMRSLLWGDTWAALHQVPLAWEAVAASFRSGTVRPSAEDDDPEAGSGAATLKWLNQGCVSPVLWARELGRLLDRAMDAWNTHAPAGAPIPERWELVRADLVRFYSRYVLRWSLTWEAAAFAMVSGWLRVPVLPALEPAARSLIESAALEAPSDDLPTSS